MITDNPITDFVELPEDCSDLQYSNLLCGVIRGAFEMVSTEQFRRPHQLTLLNYRSLSRSSADLCGKCSKENPRTSSGSSS